MKLFIQIPCFNEEKLITQTLDTLPKKIPGIDEIEYLIIDDGSEDDTVKVVKQWGVTHIVKLSEHSGLAKAFISGLEYCIQNNADIIVNTDADNQYNSEDIAKLVEPILKNKAELTVGVRPIDEIKTFLLNKEIVAKIWKLGCKSCIEFKCNGCN